MDGVVLITGGSGSFGGTMVRHLLARGASLVRVFSRDEAKHDAMRSEIGDDRVKYVLGDVRDRSSVDSAMQGVDAVFHAAALKQVPSCEFFPLEAVKTNVLGSENVIRSGIAHGVRSVVCLSTDKAVFPINAMGMSKAMMEKVVQAAARELGNGSATRLATVRYGNVMYSRGSVIPLFVRQIRAGRPITVTEPTMTRFLMPLRDSVALVEFALGHARQGDLFIKKAAASTVLDLADAVRRLFGVPDHPIDVIGWRHGEKLFETLASAQELQGADDLGEYWRIPLDDRDLNYGKYVDEGEARSPSVSDFHSHNTERLSVAEIESLLLTLPEVRAELAAAGVGMAAPAGGR
jgi:UDP-N-acetylglucosamine 4,6-dehydratase/5-epimerase